MQYKRAAFIFKLDGVKNEIFIVPGRCFFSAFAISIFTWVEVAAHFVFKKCHATFHNDFKTEKRFTYYRQIEVIRTERTER